MHRLIWVSCAFVALGCTRPPTPPVGPATAPVEPAGDPPSPVPAGDSMLPSSADPTLDADGDGVPDIRDQCRSAAEDPDGYLDDDGCPDPYGERDTEQPLPMVDTDEHPARLE